jgi:hypothetical protein
MVSSLLAFLLAAATSHAAELEGVRLEDRVHVDGQALELNGMALRTRYYFKVYVAGLYLPAKATSAERAIESDGAKRIVLVMMRDASAEQFCESTEAGLQANHSPEELERVRPQAEALYAKIRALGEARQGARVVLDYAPSVKATTLSVDGVAQGEPIPGRDFFRALLRIWLGERPAQSDLKRLLLGVDP